MQIHNQEMDAMLVRLARLRPWREYPNLFFWISFVTLNGLLFLPIYMLNQETNTFLPSPAEFAAGVWPGLSQLMIWRDNLDPFRLSLELTLVAALWVNVPWLRRRPLRTLVVVLYLLALAYYIYEALMVTIYLADPVFYSQFYLARDGLPFLASALQTPLWAYGIALVVFAVVVAVLVALVNGMLASGSAPRLHPGTRVTVALLALLCLVAGSVYQFYTARPEMVVSSLGFKLEKNVEASIRLYDDIAGFDDSTARNVYDYTGYRLDQQPDIYLIFIESYGSVLYKRPDFRVAYSALLTELEDQMQDAGWHAVSALSESPTWGGGSWLAYTSLLFGLRIDNQPQYLSLFNKYQVEDYPSLGRYLASQGYHYAWVSAIEDKWDDRRWAQYARFMGIDQLLRFRDLDYAGPGYGWGPAPPDQYMLHYANEVLKESTDKPLFFSAITQNSHYPWELPPAIVDDWRTLNQEEVKAPAPDPDEIDHATKRQNYMRAVEYELRMLTDFILKNGDEHSLFILVGDHQPPQVSRRADGWDTPMHVIAKDRALVDAFTGYGFVPGLEVESPEPALHHEGFYSLFLNVLVDRFGADHVARPAFLPAGVTPGVQNKAIVN